MKKIKDFIFGLKRGFNMPLLPEKIMIFHNSPLIRIFRVIGGLSILACLGKGVIIDQKWIIYILPITTIYVLYILVMLILKIKHIRYLWKSGKL
jgi:hypothetical protein